MWEKRECGSSHPHQGEETAAAAAVNAAAAIRTQQISPNDTLLFFIQAAAAHIKTLYIWVLLTFICHITCQQTSGAFAQILWSSIIYYIQSN